MQRVRGSRAEAGKEAENELRFGGGDRDPSERRTV